MRKILLIDVDSKIPNLAIMRISGYYKAQGYSITLYRLGFSGYPHERKSRKYINARGFDKVFISVVFRCNNGIVRIENCKEVCFGGSGHDISKRLPTRIEESDPDYSIYPENNFSYGFITRGCNRSCYFCIVPQKEGSTHFKNKIETIIKYKKVRFLDNNILGYEGCRDILKELIDKNIRCVFYQGLDIRLVDDEIAALLSQLNYIGEYTFAFDDIKLMRIIDLKIAILKRFIKKDWKIRVFIYCNAEMDIKTEVMPRIKWCRDNRVLPYLMRDENCFKSNDKMFYSEVTRWCAQPALFKKVSFEQFLKKRTISEKNKNKLKIMFRAANA